MTAAAGAATLSAHGGAGLTAPADAGLAAHAGAGAGLTEYCFEVEPPWPYRLPKYSAANGLMPVRGGVLQRYICDPDDPDGEGVLARVALGSGGRVLFALRSPTRALAEWAFVRLRSALGVDLDLREFHRRFKADPLIGESIRRQPTLRIFGRVTGFEALACAITEQLIEFQRASQIQRRMIRLLGPLDPRSGLRDFPQAARVAGAAPALLIGCELAASRSRALREAAKLAANGCLALDCEDRQRQERDWSRLRRIPGVGSWTVEMLAVLGQRRLDQLPAGDLGYLKFVGRRLSGGDPRALASEQEVRDCFDPYGEWRALAAAHALSSASRMSPL